MIGNIVLSIVQFLTSLFQAVFGQKITQNELTGLLGFTGTFFMWYFELISIDTTFLAVLITLLFIKRNDK